MKLNTPLFKRLAATGVLSFGALLAGTHITSEQEGIKYFPYLDSGGVITVCRGHVSRSIEMRWYTQDECDALYIKDLKTAQDAVARLVKVKIPPTLEASLIDFVLNVGVGNFSSSTLLKELNAGNTGAACDQLLRWVYVKKKDCRIPTNNCSGIPKRRDLERDWCMGKYHIIGDEILYYPLQPQNIQRKE